MGRFPALILLALLVAAPASATTMVELSQEELTYVADLIVEAEVEASEPERVDGGIWITSVVTLRLTRVLKGDAIEGDRVLVRELGGAIDGESTEVASTPVYTPGERVFVFLEWEQRADPMMRTIGMNQGKFTMIEEVDTGRDVLIKNAPRTGPVFDEAAVRVPAAPRYCEPVRDAVLEQVTAGFIPAYTRIPGLPQHKDDRFLAEAIAAGQTIDPRWHEVRAQISAAPGGAR